MNFQFKEIGINCVAQKMGSRDIVNLDKQIYIFKVAYGELLTVPSQTLTHNYKNPKPPSSVRGFGGSLLCTSLRK